MIPSHLEVALRLYDVSDVLIAMFDPDDRLRYANRAFRETFFVEASEQITWSDMMRRNHVSGRGTAIQTDDFETWLISAASRRGKTQNKYFEFDLIDGRWMWMTETVDISGWMLCVASDITTVHTHHRQVRLDRDIAIRASYTDELTGIGNRRFAQERAEQLIARASPSHSVTGCIAIIDIDHFKRINDRFGHNAGDEVLTDFARRLQAYLRRHDSFGRIGGEEFCVILPETSLRNGMSILGDMQREICAQRPFSQAPDFSYSFSAGLAVVRRGDTFQSVYRRADEALYRAKQSGRNRVETEESGAAAEI